MSDSENEDEVNTGVESDPTPGPSQSINAQNLQIGDRHYHLHPPANQPAPNQPAPIQPAVAAIQPARRNQPNRIWMVPVAVAILAILAGIWFINQPNPQQPPRAQLDTFDHDFILRESLTKKADVITESLPADPVPLDVIIEHLQMLEKFGTKELFIKETSLVPLENLFLEAKNNSIEEAKSKYLGQASFNEYVEKYGNTVGVVGIAGIAGIGKTTLAKQFLKNIRDESFWDFLRSILFAKDKFYLFFIDLKKLDKNKEINVFEFLVKSIITHWEFKKDKDKLLLTKLSKSSNVYIIMDGLDEARFTDLSTEAPVIGLYDRAKPVVILENLLRGDILATAYKLLASRPGAYHKLHPSCKPHFTVRVIGFNEISQEWFFQKIGINKEENEKVKMSLEQNPSAKALCFIPIFPKTLASYIIKHGSSDGLFTVTDVLASFVADCIRSPKFQNDAIILRNLSHLALNGMLQDKFIFEMKDFNEVGLNVTQLEDFIKFQAFSDNKELKLLEGDKVYFFVHLLWQEFFAALKLMFDTDIGTFSQFIQRMESDQWEMVLRFLFGLLNPDLQGKLRPIFQISQTEVAIKKGLLTNLATSLASKVPVDQKWAKSVTAKLFKVCAFAHESGDEDIITSVGNFFPGKLHLDGTILPSHVTSLSHVLRATKRKFIINIGRMGDKVLYRTKFTSNALEMLMDTIKQNDHKMGNVYIVTKKASDFTALFSCAHKIDELSLSCPNIALPDLKVLTDGITNLPEPMEGLFLYNTKLGSNGLALLAKSIHNLKILSLWNCDFYGPDSRPLTDAISRLDRPMKGLGLYYTKLGSNELALLAKSIHNVKKLFLRNCYIKETDLQPLTDAISRLDQPMKALDLGGNNIGSEGAALLRSCAHKVKLLWLRENDISEVDLESLRKLTTVELKEH